MPVVVVADQQSQIAACDGFLDEFGLLDATGFSGKGRKREQQEGNRQREGDALDHTNVDCAPEVVLG